MVVLILDDLFLDQYFVVKCCNRLNVEHDILIVLIEMNVYNVYVV